VTTTAEAWRHWWPGEREQLGVPPGRMAELDAARRCSDIVRQAIVDGHAGRWLAIRLSDGGSDRVPYESKAHAVRHQFHEQQCAYVRVPVDDMSPRAAESYLRVNRALYAAGMRLADPDGPGGDPERQLIIPAELEAAERFVARYGRRGRGGRGGGGYAQRMRR